MEKQIIYTDAGKKALELYFENQKKEIENYCIIEKYVLGDEIVEITAIDINEFQTKKQYVLKKERNRKKIQSLIELYIIFGAVITIIGSLFPILKNMSRNSPEQFVFIISGSTITLVSSLMWYILYRKDKKEKPNN